jgi:phosphoglycerate-specific signal transduction histidine kinase
MMVMLTEHEYNRLRDERDRLVELEKKATLGRHRTMIKQQLDTIRQTIKEAHHERYRTTGQA